ncbi:hypothetical protein [Pedobacter aquatilis]|uniref:hypothetical protein n=1 Tax=Pedobacter aquatilis TaxID=351343 RepID=UPI00293176C2|nr:hypothetical protein [Pedobacter aquatilis]
MAKPIEKINITGTETDLVADELKPSRKGKLFGKKVAISVSLNEDLLALGLSEQHLNDISIEIARYIIANEGVAMYGGDLRVGGFTYYFSELSNQYKKEDDKSFRFTNYFVFPTTKLLTKDVRIDFKSKQIEINEVRLPNGLVPDNNKKYQPADDVQDRLFLSECFRVMRLKMAKDCDARVLVGGKFTNFLGYIPGVIEEALYCLENDKPIFLIGGFGGATQKLIRLIKGEEVEELSNDFQYNNTFLKKFKEVSEEKYEYSDFDKLRKKLKKYNVKKLSKLNKLSIEENEVLFGSKNIHEIVYLMMKGLKSI